MDIFWVGLAFLAGLLVSRIKLPPLVGYLAAGALLSSYGYEGGSLLHEIAHLGVLFLLFTVGLHLRLKNIFRAEVLGAGGIHLLFSILIFTPVAYLFGYSLVPSLLLATLLGFSSTVLTAKNLERRKELGAYHGRVAIGILIFQDLVAIALLALTGGESPSPWGIALLGIPLLRPALIKVVELAKEEELKLLSGLMLALGGSAIFEVAGLSSELGALVAGMLISGHREADILAEKLWGLKEAFLVGFFLEVGLTGLPNLQDLYFIVVVLGLLAVKGILFYLLFIAFKLRARTSFVTTVSLTSYSEFTLIAGTVAVNAGYLPAGTVVALAVLTAISYAINAPLSRWEEELWQRYERFLVPMERDVRHPDQQPISLGAAEYLIVGMGNAGQAAYDRLKTAEKHVVGMDIDPARIERNLSQGRRVFYGDLQDPMLWENIELNNVKSVVLAIGSQEAKVNATKLMRKNKYQGQIFALTMHEDEHNALKEAGASAVCLPITQAGRRLAELSLGNQSGSETIALQLDT